MKSRKQKSHKRKTFKKFRKSGKKNKTRMKRHMMIKKGGEKSVKNYYADETGLNSSFVDPNRKQEERKKIYYMSPLLEGAFRLPQNASAVLDRGHRVLTNPLTVSEIVRTIGNNESIERITKLIDKATNLNVTTVSTKYDGKVSPLMAAIYANKYDIVKYLINKGADVNYESKYGDTPLLIAINNSNREKKKEEKGEENNYDVSCDIVELLIEKGANVSSLNIDGINPIEHAIHGNNYDIMDLLFEKGVNINDKNGSGNTPLHLAVYGINLAIVNFLIGKGADVNEINAKNMTPLSVAKYKLDHRRNHTDRENITLEAIFQVLARKDENLTETPMTSPMTTPIVGSTKLPRRIFLDYDKNKLIYS